MSRITAQAVLDASYQAFIVENRPPAVNDNGECCYKTASGKRCSIGLCIPDGHPALRSRAAAGMLVEEYPELFDPDVCASTLTYMQRQLHDEMRFKARWRYSVEWRKERYKNIARELGLIFPGDANE